MVFSHSDTPYTEKNVYPLGPVGGWQPTSEKTPEAEAKLQEEDEATTHRPTPDGKTTSALPEESSKTHLG